MDGSPDLGHDEAPHAPAYACACETALTPVPRPAPRCDSALAPVLSTASHHTARRERATELEHELLELTGHLNAGTYRWLNLLADFDAVGGWHGAGVQSLAHWLNWKCGLDLGAARERVRVASALPGLPRIAAAMARGALSYSKVRALTRVAEPATEAYLIELALHGTAAHVERVVRAYRRAREVQELGREAAQQASRCVTWHVDDDGSYVIRARLPAESGALFVRALDAAVEAMPVPHVSAETYVTGVEIAGRPRPDTDADGTPRPSWSARRADALGAIAETFLRHGLDPLVGGERAQLVVHVDVETLAHRVAGRCEADDGPALAAETVRRLGCDASLVAIVARGTETLDVGRRTRTVPPALRRALEARDRGCRFPGCSNRRFVDGHHVHHWADGGATSLANLVSLCRYHHRLVHEGGFGVARLDDGAWRFTRPDGSTLRAEAEQLHAARNERACSHATAHDVSLRREHARSGLTIDASTAVTRWTGERLDCGHAVDLLLQQAQRGVSAET
jgi:hypothetical protein